MNKKLISSSFYTTSILLSTTGTAQTYPVPSSNDECNRTDRRFLVHTDTITKVSGTRRARHVKASNNTLHPNHSWEVLTILQQPWENSHICMHPTRVLQIHGYISSHFCFISSLQQSHHRRYHLRGRLLVEGNANWSGSVECQDRRGTWFRSGWRAKSRLPCQLWIGNYHSKCTGLSIMPTEGVYLCHRHG